MTYLFGISSGGSGSTSTNVRVVTASGAITQTNTDGIIVVNKAVAAPTTVTLLSSPTAGSAVTIKDGRGDCNYNPITIYPASGTIDGQPTVTINVPWSSATFVYNGSSWNASQANLGLVRNTETPDGTSASTTAVTIFASPVAFTTSAGSLDTFSLDGAGHIIHNGSTDSSIGATVSALAYQGHAVYAETSAGSWYLWNTSATLSATNIIPDTTTGTIGTFGSGGSLAAGWTTGFNQLTASLVAKGTDTATGVPYYDIAMSGVDTTGNAQIALPNLTTVASGTYTMSFYVGLAGGSTAGITAVDGGWNQASATGGYIATSGVIFDTVMPTSTTLTRLSGTATVTATSAIASPFIGFEIPAGSTINATFRIGGVQFEKGASASGYQVTPNVGAKWVSSTSGPTAIPAAASGAGYTNRIYFADFVNASEVSSTNTGVANLYNYNAFDPNNTAGLNMTTSDYNVANGLLNIPATHLLSLGSGVNPYAGLSSINTQSPTNTTPTAHAANTGNGLAFQYGYFEASCYWAANVSNTAKNMWPAFWSYATDNFVNPSNTNPWLELDFFEAFPGSGTSNVICTAHQWYSGSNNGFSNSNNAISLPGSFNPNGYNIYGCLWTPTAITWYINNTQVATISTTTAVAVTYSGGWTAPTGKGSANGTGTETFTAANVSHVFLQTGDLMNIDWIKVWQ